MFEVTFNQLVRLSFACFPGCYLNNSHVHALFMLYSCSSDRGTYCDGLKQWNLLVDYLTKFKERGGDCQR